MANPILGRVTTKWRRFEPPLGLSRPLSDTYGTASVVSGKHLDLHFTPHLPVAEEASSGYSALLRYERPQVDRIAHALLRYSSHQRIFAVNWLAVNRYNQIAANAKFHIANGDQLRHRPYARRFFGMPRNNCCTSKPPRLANLTPRLSRRLHTLW